MKHQEPVKHPGPVKHPEDKHEPAPGIVQPMIDELRNHPKDSPLPKAPPDLPRDLGHPLEPAEQDQDAGGGYNPDHTIPQP